MNTIESKGIARKLLKSHSEVYLKQKLEESLERGWEQIGEISLIRGHYGVCVKIDIAKNSRKNQIKKEVRT